ncbi:MAG: hypothetical protein IPK60_25420 [Sandaracinaceae bacterium]|jgi:hypothetical protein|nr:hypothetical protein [Sandaracinaceae bacterium]
MIRALTCSSPAWICLCLALAACASGHEGSEPQQQRADARTLRAALAHDRSQGPLHDADNAVQDRRPVLAAELIRNGGLPAIARARAAVADASTRTPEGNAARSRLLAAYDEHTRTLDAYAHVLERGEVEDIALLEAVHNERVAQQNTDQAIEGVGRLEQAQ